jgi:asparagine synthase (glutamine-hydrolysing)
MGEDDRGSLCFTSEVKALVDVCEEVTSVPPGCKYDGKKLKPYFELKEKETFDEQPDILARGLKHQLVDSVRNRIDFGSEIGAWLSGGIDSSALAALIRPTVNRLYTFTAGLEGSTDLEFAREVAGYSDSEHHEIVVEFSELLRTIPKVIFHLESIDALLVRSSLMNYLVILMTFPGWGAQKMPLKKVSSSNYAGCEDSLFCLLGMTSAVRPRLWIHFLE